MRNELKVNDYDDKYLVFVERVSYNRAVIPRLLEFTRVLTHTDASQEDIILDQKRELSWFFVVAPGDSVLPDDAFIVEKLTVGSQPFKEEDATVIKEEGLISYTFTIPDEIRKDRSAKISYTLRVKQARSVGYYSFVISLPTRKVEIDFQFASKVAEKLQIEDVHCVSTYLTSSKKADVENVSKYRKVVTTDSDTWTLPNSGVIFSWSEKSMPDIANPGNRKE